jgi:hypothetical protein
VREVVVKDLIQASGLPSLLVADVAALGIKMVLMADLEVLVVVEKVRVLLLAELAHKVATVVALQ